VAHFAFCLAVTAAASAASSAAAAASTFVANTRVHPVGTLASANGMIPKLILDNIFVHLPSMSYRSTCARVCKDWSKSVGLICTDDQLAAACDFNLWKDLYIPDERFDEHGQEYHELLEKVGLLQKKVVWSIMGLETCNLIGANDYIVPWAAATGHADVLLRFAETTRGRARFDCLGNLSIQRASRLGHLNCVKVLTTQPGVFAWVNGNYSIRYSALFGFSSVVEYLIGLGERVDVSSRSQWCMRAACIGGFLYMTNLLKDNPKVDFQTHGNMFVQDAAEQKNWEVLIALMNSSQMPRPLLLSTLYLFSVFVDDGLVTEQPILDQYYRLVEESRMVGET